MKTIRTLAAGLLILTGVLHLISVALAKFEATSIITIVFGVAYLAIGYFLFRDGRPILWFGVISAPGGSFTRSVRHVHVSDFAGRDFHCHRCCHHRLLLHSAVPQGIREDI